MKQATRVLILLMAVMTCLVSCKGDEPVGKWDKMKWKLPDGLTREKSAYIVPASGGTFTFTCKNYGAPWLSSITDGTEYLYPVFLQDGAEETEPDFHSFKCEWFEVKCVEADVNITFAPLDSSTESRQMSVTVTAGDIFDTFTFIQRH